MKLLNAAGLTEARLPLPVPAGTIAGKMDSEAANALGVGDGTPVVVGGHDQACGALGVGAIQSGRVSDSMGTYECLTAASDEPRLGDEAFAARLNSYCHVVPGKFLTLAYFPSGIMVQWFRDLIYVQRRATERGDGRGGRDRRAQRIFGVGSRMQRHSDGTVRDSASHRNMQSRFRSTRAGDDFWTGFEFQSKPNLSRHPRRNRMRTGADDGIAREREWQVPRSLCDRRRHPFTAGTETAGRRSPGAACMRCSATRRCARVPRSLPEWRPECIRVLRKAWSSSCAKKKWSSRMLALPTLYAGQVKQYRRLCAALKSLRDANSCAESEGEKP